MKDAVLQRVIEISKLKSNSEAQFAKLIGASQKTINQQFKGDRALSLDTIMNIITSFEDISAEWLLRGKGEMYLSTASTTDNQLIENLKEELLMLKGENRVLREQIGLGERKDKGVKSAS